MRFFSITTCLGIASVLLAVSAEGRTQVRLFPANNSKNVNADTRLTLEFSDTPILHRQGMIRIFDAATGLLADSLNMSLPDGPTEPAVRDPQATYTKIPYDYTRTAIPNNRTVKPGTPSGTAERGSSDYQLTIIGGFTDGFHFHPVMIRGKKAVICPHNQMLLPGHTYYVTIDDGLLTTADGKFHGFREKNAWRFSTKVTDTVFHDTLIVSADGRGDYSTVQGAMDAIGDEGSRPVVVFVRNGDYEEIVYFRNKSHVTILGESRDGVIIHYANNEVFNPHPRLVLTNEMKGTFPSRRAAFAVDNSCYVVIKNLTLRTDLKGQAEGLLVNGENNKLCNVHIVGDGDALQVNGSVLIDSCRIDGGGDTILGRGPALFRHCSLFNTGGPFVWVRNTAENHGDVFIDCCFCNSAGTTSSLARSPFNKGKYYPYAEVVLIDCTLCGIVPQGWEALEGDTSHNHFWEYDSRDKMGNKVDVSKRHQASRQLMLPGDADLLRNYRNSIYVLGLKK